MLSSKRLGAMRREPMAAGCIPYSAHVSERVVRTVHGDYLQVFRLGGASFESADDDQLNTWHERLNTLWRNLASPQVALWTHMIRRRERCRLAESGNGDFAARLEAKYRARLAQDVLMVNELYLAVLYRPAAGMAPGMVAGLVRRGRRDLAQLERTDALDACARMADTLRAALLRYEPEPLGCYRVGGLWCSAVLEYLGVLVNGEWQRMPLARGPVNRALATSRVLFGSEALEYRTMTRTRLGAFLAIKEYPTPTSVGMYHRLLCAPFPLVLTQSFAFLSKAAGQGLLQRQIYRMENAGDFALSQTAELKEALDALTSNLFVMADHHFSLQALVDCDEDCTHALRSLNERMAWARSVLADTGMLVAREDLALEAAFWAQLPGNFAFRPRKAPITSRNFAAMMPFHNYPSGRPCGNHWGDALALFATSARSPYYFSLHASDPSEPDGGARADTGHTFICGPTGSGKTVFIGFLIALLHRQGATQVIFDKDHGLEILVRALNGVYLPLGNGVATGLNPLQLPAGPQHVEFQKAWLRALARSTGEKPLSVRESADLDQALHGTLALEPRARRLSRLIEFLDPTESEGVYARLARWCEACHGDYAWVFDNEVDQVLPRLGSGSILGFDVTDFLGSALVRQPVTLYLFHLVRQLLDGRRLVCWMDEFWRLLADDAFAAFAKDAPKTWRKLNAVLCLATQSVSDVLDSAISRTIVEQTATQVFFPNAEASAAEYMDGFGLSQREFRLVKEQLEPGQRMFLVKQGHRSVVCRLDLRGLDAELSVISGRASSVERLHRVMDCHGTDSARWLPAFLSSEPL